MRHDVAAAAMRESAAGAGIRDPAARAAAVVRRFLAAMEARDLAAARALTGAGFAMTFPGGSRFDDLEAVVAWARPRYRRLAKRFEGFDTVPTPAGAVVWSFGTLAGEWPDGRPFAGIRFVDRFTVKGGLIVDQRAWNDLAEAPAEAGT